jgi:hypothetical protein
MMILYLGTFYCYWPNSNGNSNWFIS